MDIAQKLMLDSPEDAEYIVAKVRSIYTVHALGTVVNHFVYCRKGTVHIIQWTIL